MSVTLRDLGFEADAPVTGLTCDSRAVKPGYVFAALPGTVSDGRDYIEVALKAGAGAILSTEGLSIDAPYIGSAMPRLSYAQMAARLYPNQPQTVAAITGTNGKSSTVDFLRQIWAYAGLSAACFGTIGVHAPSGLRPMTHTTPDAVALHQTLHDLAEEGVTHVAMEASSHGLDQYRLDGVKVKASGFTNLTQDHFDYHGDMDSYFQAKARLFAELTPEGAPVIINVDDEYGQELAELCGQLGQKVTKVGLSGTDIQIVSLAPRASSQIMEVAMGYDVFEIELPLAGLFQAYNAVTALGLALATGVERDTAISALKSLKGVAGRMELAGKTAQGAPIFVDFAHSEGGLKTLLESVRPHISGKIVLVFGCGGDRDTDKRAKMGRVAAELADEVIVTDDNPRSEKPAAIRAAVLQGCPDAVEQGDRAKAIREGIARLGENDCLIIAGKGHEQGQIIGKKTIPFLDVDEVKKALKESARV